MRSFWSLIENDKYKIGCTGQTVCLFDKQDNEIAKFRDLPYAYTPAISPRGDVFVVKTTEGRMAVYSFDPPRLIKKFRYSKVDGAQDDNFCFSPEGDELYNIERHGDSFGSALSVYDTSDFSLKRRILGDDVSRALSGIEIDKITGDIYLLVFYRNNNGEASRFFVGKLVDGDLRDTVPVTKSDYEFYEMYLSLKMSGFSKKRYEPRHFGVELEELKTGDYSLASLWARNRGWFHGE